MKSKAQQIEEPTNEELRVLTRRSALRLIGGAGLALVAGCASDEQGNATTSLATTTSTGAATATTAVPSPTTRAIASSPTFGNAGSCVLIPEETAGPFPLDLSEGEQFFRADITEGKEGVPMTLTLAIVDVNSDCAPLSGTRIDLWHCDALGAYSGFQQQGVDTNSETFCRGIQLADANGQVSFTIFPGWYEGRITHIHFQVFLGSGLQATSQIAFPEEITDAVYAVEPYTSKGPNTSVASIDRDMVFSDGSQYQIAAITGGADTRLLATLLVGVAV